MSVTFTNNPHHSQQRLSGSFINKLDKVLVIRFLFAPFIHLLSFLCNCRFSLLVSSDSPSLSAFFLPLLSRSKLSFLHIHQLTLNPSILLQLPFPFTARISSSNNSFVIIIFLFSSPTTIGVDKVNGFTCTLLFCCLL